MFEKVMLPLDGSKLAEEALPYGEDLAKRFGSELVLYHVCSVEHEKFQNMHKIYLENLAKSIETDIRKEQPDTQASVRTEVEMGEPSEDICNLVEKDKISLLVMSAVSVSGLKIGKMLGSVTDHTCRTVPIPVLLIRPKKEGFEAKKAKRINHILLTLDGSEPSKLAVPVAEEMAARLKVPMTLYQMARIVVPYADDMGNTAFVSYSELSDYEEKRVRDEIVTLETKMKGKGLDVTHRVTLGMDAAEEIIEAGKQAGADLIIMATHGRSGLRRWALGSVAERVLRHAEVPILLVNARAA
jgi:nucleotide-binding universal stress UspA family protein